MDAFKRPSRGLSHLDLEFMEYAFMNRYYEVALPYAVRPFFDIESDSMSLKDICRYYLFCTRVCIECGKFPEAFLAAKMGLSVYDNTDEDIFVALFRYEALLSILVDGHAIDVSNFSQALIQKINFTAREFLQLENDLHPRSSYTALSSSSSSSSGNESLSHFFSEFSVDFDAVQAKIVSNISAEDYCLNHLLETVIAEQKNLQLVRMMHTFGKMELTLLASSLKETDISKAITAALHVSDTGKVLVNINQRDNIVTFDDDESFANMKREIEYVVSLSKALKDVEGISAGAISLRENLNKSSFLKEKKESELELY